MSMWSDQAVSTDADRSMHEASVVPGMRLPAGRRRAIWTHAERTHGTLQPFELGYARTELRRSLVELVLLGRKTSTAGLRIEYEPNTRDPLPRIGHRYMVVGFDDEPVGVVETVDVEVVPACDVDVAFVRDEGEGFETVAEWLEAHERFWVSNGVVEGLRDETLVVCERFRLVERLEHG